MARTKVTHYFDYKSPYAYLAQEETFRLQDEFDVEVEWLPYTLDVPSYLGAAEVDETGRVLHEARTAHQWRRVRYAYLDCRREATRRGLIIKGPRKIFDSSVAHIGMLYAKRQGDFRPYHGVHGAISQGETIRPNENFRSSTGIVLAACQVVENNDPHRLPKKMESAQARKTRSFAAEMPAGEEPGGLCPFRPALRAGPLPLANLPCQTPQ